MKFGVFFFGGVEMDSAGAGPPAPMDRHYGPEAVWDATEKYLNLGVRADELGYESFWATEHHFQYEGYEIMPNPLLLSAWLAARTTNIKLGAMFSIVPQWHPLRLAEDFATVHNLSKGRALLGVGRGTVPREIENLTRGVSIGSWDNAARADADRINREVFDEAMEIIKLALDSDSFSYSGKHFQYPAADTIDRGADVETLELIPRPLYPYEIWQPISSPPTLEKVPADGHSAVFWQQHPDFIKGQWERYGELWHEHQGEELSRGDKRMLVLHIRVADSHEEAVAQTRPGHDEHWKFLGPYGWSKGYKGPDGKPAESGLIPTLEESLEQRMWALGTPDDVAATIDFYREEIGVEYMTIFPMLPGDTYAQATEQIERFAGEVMPLLD